MKRHNRRTRTTPVVLIVEDDLATRAGYADYLRLEGMDVREAGTVAEGFDVVLGAPPDVILLDIRLPDNEGWDLCRELNRDARTRDIPIVVITGLDPSAKAPCDAVLRKPIAPEALVFELRQALQKGHLLA